MTPRQPAFSEKCRTQREASADIVLASSGGPTGDAGARPPVMADVARLARVSHQTVSRVVNGHPNVALAWIL